MSPPPPPPTQDEPGSDNDDDPFAGYVVHHSWSLDSEQQLHDIAEDEDELSELPGYELGNSNLDDSYEMSRVPWLREDARVAAAETHTTSVVAAPAEEGVAMVRQSAPQLPLQPDPDSDTDDDPFARRHPPSYPHGYSNQPFPLPQPHHQPLPGPWLGASNARIDAASLAPAARAALTSAPIPPIAAATTASSSVTWGLSPAPALSEPAYPSGSLAVVGATGVGFTAGTAPLTPRSSSASSSSGDSDPFASYVPPPPPLDGYGHDVTMDALLRAGGRHHHHLHQVPPGPGAWSSSASSADESDLDPDPFAALPLPQMRPAVRREPQVAAALPLAVAVEAADESRGEAAAETAAEAAVAAAETNAAEESSLADAAPDAAVLAAGAAARATTPAYAAAEEVMLAVGRPSSPALDEPEAATAEEPVAGPHAAEASRVAAAAKGPGAAVGAAPAQRDQGAEEPEAEDAATATAGHDRACAVAEDGGVPADGLEPEPGSPPQGPAEAGWEGGKRTDGGGGNGCFDVVHAAAAAAEAGPVAEVVKVEVRPLALGAAGDALPVGVNVGLLPDAGDSSSSGEEVALMHAAVLAVVALVEAMAEEESEPPPLATAATEKAGLSAIADRAVKPLTAQQALPGAALSSAAGHLGGDEEPATLVAVGKSVCEELGGAVAEQVVAAAPCGVPGVVDAAESPTPSVGTRAAEPVAVPQEGDEGRAGGNGSMAVDGDAGAEGTNAAASAPMAAAAAAADKATAAAGDSAPRVDAGAAISPASAPPTCAVSSTSAPEEPPSARVTASETAEAQGGSKTAGGESPSAASQASKAEPASATGRPSGTGTDEDSACAAVARVGGAGDALTDIPPAGGAAQATPAAAASSGAEANRGWEPQPGRNSSRGDGDGDGGSRRVSLCVPLRDLDPASAALSESVCTAARALCLSSAEVSLEPDVDQPEPRRQPLSSTASRAGGCGGSGAVGSCGSRTSLSQGGSCATGRRGGRERGKEAGVALPPTVAAAGEEEGKEAAAAEAAGAAPLSGTVSSPSFSSADVTVMPPTAAPGGDPGHRHGLAGSGGSICSCLSQMPELQPVELPAGPPPPPPALAVPTCAVLPTCGATARSQGVRGAIPARSVLKTPRQSGSSSGYALAAKTDASRPAGSSAQTHPTAGRAGGRQPTVARPPGLVSSSSKSSLGLSTHRSFDAGTALTTGKEGQRRTSGQAATDVVPQGRRQPQESGPRARASGSGSIGASAALAAAPAASPGRQAVPAAATRLGSRCGGGGGDAFAVDDRHSDLLACPQVWLKHVSAATVAEAPAAAEAAATAAAQRPQSTCSGSGVGGACLSSSGLSGYGSSSGAGGGGDCCSPFLARTAAAAAVAATATAIPGSDPATSLGPQWGSHVGQAGWSSRCTASLIQQYSYSLPPSPAPPSRQRLDALPGMPLLTELARRYPLRTAPASGPAVSLVSGQLYLSDRLRTAVTAAGARSPATTRAGPTAVPPGLMPPSAPSTPLVPPAPSSWGPQGVQWSPPGSGGLSNYPGKRQTTKARRALLLGQGQGQHQHHHHDDEQQRQSGAGEAVAEGRRNDGGGGSAAAGGWDSQPPWGPTAELRGSGPNAPQQFGRPSSASSVARRHSAAAAQGGGTDRDPRVRVERWLEGTSVGRSQDGAPPAPVGRALKSGDTQGMWSPSGGAAASAGGAGAGGDLCGSRRTDGRIGAVRWQDPKGGQSIQIFRLPQPLPLPPLLALAPGAWAAAAATLSTASVSGGAASGGTLSSRRRASSLT